LATHVIILNEIVHPEHRQNGWRLCLQWARYQYDDKSEPQTGYRFIWRRPDGSLQPARGQARIPSLADAELLIRLARELGWGEQHADDALGQVQLHLVRSNKCRFNRSSRTNIEATGLIGHSLSSVHLRSSLSLDIIKRPC
jgi:hypothetical protein